MTLLVGCYLGNDDEQTGMNFLACIEFPEIASIVGDEGEVLGDDAKHQIPIGLSAQSEPVDVSGLMATRLCYRNKGRVQAFVDEELYADTRAFRIEGPGSPFNVARFEDVTFKP